MRIYSNTLVTADFTSCLPDSRFYFEHLRPLKKVLLRARGWEVLIGRQGSRRRFNTGTYGAGCEGAATWDEWGQFIAALYEKDPDMRAGTYFSKGHFHATTGNRYVPVPPIRRT